MAEKPQIDAGAIASAASGLKSVPAEAKSSHANTAEEKALLDNLEQLYNKHSGDVNAIFAELGENPEKALRHPPASAHEFAEKYSQGFYTATSAELK